MARWARTFMPFGLPASTMPPSAHIGKMKEGHGRGEVRLRVIDLETTGDSFTNGGVVEVGWQDVVQDADGV